MTNTTYSFKDKFLWPIVTSMVTALGLYLSGVFTVNIVIPDDAVVAFYTKKCPEGWEELPNSQRRVIIGAEPNGDSIYALGKTGGKGLITLNESNLPKHRHEAIKASTFDKSSGGSNYAEPLPSSSSSPVEYTGYAGHERPEAFNNEQPWVALNLCRKLG